MNFNRPFLQALNNLKAFDLDQELDLFLKDFLNTSFRRVFVKQVIALRTYAFKLEAFGRVLRSCKGDAVAETGAQIRDASKVIEDAFGRYLYCIEMYELVLENGSKLIEESKSDVVLASLKLSDEIQLLKTEVSRIEILMSELPKDLKKIRKLYLKGTRRELKKIHEKITKEIDPDLLEDGTHKLRRLIRWVIMYFIYPQGLFAFDKKPAKPSPFLNLRPSAINEPVSVSYKLLAELSAAVGSLGKQKDGGLFEHYLHDLKNHKVDINKSDVSTVSFTRETIQLIKDKQQILKLRKQLK